MTVSSSAGKKSPCNAGDPSSIPGAGRSAREGIGYPLQYSWASLVAQMVENLPAVEETFQFHFSVLKYPFQSLLENISNWFMNFILLLSSSKFPFLATDLWILNPLALWIGVLWKAG